uniref:YhdP central domain-containing protein n=1 Tax=Rhodopseudomonas palustris (strain DX-1) TaxID=652103 RepID=E6VM16_RHOPX
MPPQERILRDGAHPSRDQQAPHARVQREAMAKHPTPDQSDPHAGHDRNDPTWHEGGQWDHEHDEDARYRARKLLKRRNLGLHSIDDWSNRRTPAAPWLKRTLLTLAIVGMVLVAGFAGVWLRLGAGPINLDMVTPWLADAIEDNIGHGNTVEIGGTQIERAGRIRVAVRIRDIVVRDRDNVVIASAPKAEVRLSGSALLMGRLRAESLRLVGAELAIRIDPEGQVTVSTGATARPLATGVAPTGRPAEFKLPTESTPPAATPMTPDGSSSATATPAPGSDNSSDPMKGMLAALAWLDGLSMAGLDGQNLNEIGLKNGSLVVEDEQRGNRWTFENISLSLRRPSHGGVALSIGEEGTKAWSLRVQVGAAQDGVRAVELHANQVPTRTVLLALRLKNLTYSADFPLTGDFKGEVGRDGVPTYFRGKLTAGAGTVIDFDTPDYPMAIDQIETSFEWDANRRVLIAPFKVLAGPNRVTLLASLEPPNGSVNDWRLGLSGGTIVLPGAQNESPLIFNRIAVRVRFDSANRRVLLTQADVSNGEIGVAGSGSIDYSGEPRLTLGLAGTPMSVSALKRMWPVLIVPELREWVNDRIRAGSIQTIDIAINSPMKNLSRRGPPIPDEGLLVNILGSGATIYPVDGMPTVKDADMRVRVTGRTATVAINQANADTDGGRKIALSDILFEVPDLAPKPAPSRIRFKLEGPVPGVAEVLASGRLSDAAALPIDPNTSKGNVSAQVALGMPIQRELTKQDTSYSITADLSGFSADKVAMGQKLEANTLKVIANNQGYQVKGDVKINGQAAALDYRKPVDGDADVKLQATLDDASRARLGADLGSGLSGPLGVKLNGKIGDNEQDSKFAIEADLTPVKIDNLLPGWSKQPGKPGKAAFNVVRKPQSTRLDDVTVEGGGTLIKGSLEVDPDGDLINVNFPVYSPSEGDKAMLKADRGTDGVLKAVMRGDVFDGRGFIRSALSGSSADSKGKSIDFDLDLKFGAVAGFYGEAVRSLEVKTTRRNGAIRSFNMTGKLGRDTPITADLRGRNQGREVIYLETNDAGAFFRFTDSYAKMYGGQLSLAVEPPTAEPREKEGLINVRDFTVKGEAALDRVAAGAPGGTPQGLSFSRLRAEFSRQNGTLTIRDGVVKGPTIGATIEGSIDYPANQVRMSGTFVPMYGLNNMFGQIPIVGLFLGGGSNEGLIGVTYEVVGTPGKPVLRVNPISAMAPGVLRKIFEFNTGRQNSGADFPAPPN